MRAHFLQRRRFAEPRHVLVLATVTAPGVVRPRDRRDVVVAQDAVGAVLQLADLPGVDEEHLAGAVAQRFALLPEAVPPVLRQEPEADRDLGGEEQLPRHRDDAVDQVRLDDARADRALTAGVGRQRPVGQYEPGDPVGREVVDEVLHPGEVGIARRRDSVVPTLVAPEPVAAPVADVEGRVGEDVVGPQVGMQVVVERVGVVPAEVGLDTANREVHVGQLPGRRV